jgi:PAS domain S-box-containing protein
MTDRLHTSLDLQLVFDATPGLFLALAPDSPRFTVIAATGAFLRASRMQSGDVIGRSYFEIFPDQRDATDAPALQGTRASLMRVISARVPDTLTLQRREIRQLPVENCGFDKRLWREVNSPVIDASGELVCLIHSIEPQISEQGLRKERNLAFLVELEQTLAKIDSSAGLVRVASERIVRHLQLRHCMLTEIDPLAGLATVLHEHLTAGAPALARVRPLTELRTAVQRQALASGQTLVSPDVLTEGRSAVELQRLAARGVRAQVSAPYVVDGHWKFLLTALRGQPYDWPQDEVELITDLATRVYVHLLRARAREQLVESEQRLRLAADAAHFGMYDRDLGSEDFHLSGQLKQMLGYEGDVALSHLQVMAHLHPDDRLVGQAAFKRACDPSGDGQIALEQRIVRCDGTVGWISSVGRVLFENSVPKRSIGFWIDITARKQLERETLEQTRALAEQDRRKDEFLAMLGHELRNPLAAMASAVQLLQLQCHGDDGQRQVGAIIERQAGQLKHLVDDLLEVSRITSGRVQLRRTVLDLRAVVEQAVESTAPMIAQHAHEMTVSLPTQPVWLHADAARLEQVLVNLLNNAAKYTADGGRISLTVEEQVDAMVPTAVISVSDCGIGIAPELLPQVFDLFTQADQSLHRSQGGLGIGLALVRRLVELHGGTVTAGSVPGQGSEFVVRLPLPVGPVSRLQLEPGTAVPATLDSPVPSTRCGRRVLLVDDNADAAQTLGTLLEMNGHSVRLAYDGVAAIEAAIQYRPEVVLLDIGLPGLDGYQVAQRIRQQAGLEGIVLIALTGYGLESDRLRSQQAGFDRHLVKPASLDEIEQALRCMTPNKLPC